MLKDKPENMQKNAQTNDVIPTLGVSAALYRENTLLLVKRGKEPFRGMWSLPGGSVEAGETLEQAVMREVLEETSLTIASAEFAGFHEPILHDADGNLLHHFVLARFVCPQFEGKETAGDDAADIGWFTFRQIQDLKVTEGSLEFIRSRLSGLLTER